ncbi:MAG: CDP-alcohol phosphatidyltransferase family protein [Actinomycetales bacterium]
MSGPGSGSARRPSLAELRAIAQPESTMSRRNAEHWLARLLLRRLSLPVTRELLRTPVTANQLTGLMIVIGLLAAGAAALPGLAWAIAAFVGVQLYFLLDLCDGEVARWRRSTSVTGIYLDRVGHYLVEAALLSAYGLRAGGQELGGWSTLGVAAGLFAVLVKAETDLVDVARVRSGRAAAPDDAAVPRSTALGAMRRAAQVLKVHQLTGALESSFLLLVAAIVDAASDSLRGSEVLASVMFGIAATMTVLHLVSVLASRRLD